MQEGFERRKFNYKVLLIGIFALVSFITIKLFAVVCEEPVRLMTPVVLRAKTPINVGEDFFIIEVYRTEDTTAYFSIPSSDGGRLRKKRVYQLLVHF